MANRSMGYVSWVGQMQGPRNSQQDVVLVERADGDALVLGVFDGMGGHSEGAETAQCVAQRVQKEIQSGSLGRSRSIGAWVQRVLTLANADAQESTRGGTTATLAVLTPERAVWGWAGDSPGGWLLHDGTVQQVTRPHGVGNQLFNGLGRVFQQNGPVFIEIARSPLPANAVIWVASDGLNPVLERPDVASAAMRKWTRIGGRVWESSPNGWAAARTPMVDNTSLVMGWLDARRTTPPTPAPASRARPGR